MYHKVITLHITYSKLEAVEDNLERDAPLPPTPVLEAGPNSSDMVHTKIRRQQPKSRPEIKQERKPDNRIKLYSASGHEIDCFHRGSTRGCNRPLEF